MVFFWSVQPGKVCIYVAINCHLALMEDDQQLAFRIFEIILKVLTYTNNFFLMWVLRVVGESCALVNRKCYILTGLVCNIHHNYDNWWLFPLVLVLSWIFHCICSQSRLYSCLRGTMITTIYTTSINNIIYSTVLGHSELTLPVFRKEVNFNPKEIFYGIRIALSHFQAVLTDFR